jgi:hypothetical protein
MDALGPNLLGMVCGSIVVSIVCLATSSSIDGFWIILGFPLIVIPFALYASTVMVIACALLRERIRAAGGRTAFLLGACVPLLWLGMESTQSHWTSGLATAADATVLLLVAAMPILLLRLR